MIHVLKSKALYISRVKGVRRVAELPLLCFVHQWKWRQSPDHRICTVTWWWCFFRFPKDQLVPQSDQDTQWNTRLLESVFCEIRCSINSYQIKEKITLDRLATVVNFTMLHHKNKMLHLWTTKRTTCTKFTYGDLPYSELISRIFNFAILREK